VFRVHKKHCSKQLACLKNPYFDMDMDMSINMTSKKKILGKKINEKTKNVGDKNNE
jgi:hypothetical protein